MFQQQPWHIVIIKDNYIITVILIAPSPDA